jgi:hypothetical protein
VRGVILVLAACGHAATPTPGTPDDLATYLQPLAGAEEPLRRHVVSGWILDEASWNTTIVEPYRALYADYARGFDAAAAPLVAELAHAGAITARRHFAGDPRLTRAQARLRWAVPVQYPSVVAELAGEPIDAVFVFDGASWRVLAGLDDLLLARARAIDPACGELLARAGPIGRCTEVGWAIADAALRSDRERFAHACALATSLCTDSIRPAPTSPQRQ